jgi:hypothetical protein
MSVDEIYCRPDAMRGSCEGAFVLHDVDDPLNQGGAGMISCSGSGLADFFGLVFSLLEDCNTCLETLDNERDEPGCEQVIIGRLE